MKIAIGSDHRGFDLKQVLIVYLRARGYEVTDCGTHGQSSCDYPEYARQVCTQVTAGKAGRGILICNSGIGMDMAANKFKKIRAAYCFNMAGAEFSRRHNDANVMVLGAAFVKPALAKRMVKKWLETEFEAGRHQHRVEMFSC